ncbi:hypothetical protein FHW58_002028 [Duganella sp. 1224]|uniref:hypothetical protein n=1 Tax=Duganella sp. 1224 TaxID=2587052 RepID=UPI0015CA2856|nr:hypothetical protein [Duganella sp. 1224]NYE60876.1 hypothetical protein [Duganella sp. 1224]
MTSLTSIRRNVSRGRFLALLALLSVSAHAADVVPPHLVGSWGTGASLYDGNEQQAEIYLWPDGWGLMAGSTAPARRADGVDDGQPAPRALIGWPVRASMEGDMPVLRSFAPPGVPGMKAGLVIPCRYEAAPATLTCTTPADNKTLVLKRRSAAVPAEMEKMLDQIVPKDQR